MYECILIPTDGSEYAERAAETGIGLATALGSSVSVVSVVDVGPLGSVRLPGDAGSAEDVLEERADTFVARLEERAREVDLEVTTEVRRGAPVSAILEYADEIGADLIVVGPRGRGGVERAMLGSVTDGLTRLGDIDVLVAGEDVPTRVE